MDDAKLRQALDYFAASVAALEREAAVLRAAVAGLTREVVTLRATALLEPLKPGDLPLADAKALLAERADLFQLFRGQRPNEIKPWEAM